MYYVRLTSERFIYRGADENSEKIETYTDFMVPDLRALELFVSNLACYATGTIRLDIREKEAE